MKKGKARNRERESESELEREGDNISTFSIFRHGSSPSLSSSRPQDEEEGLKEEEMKNMNPSTEDDIEECERSAETKTEVKTKRKSLHVQIREKSWFGKKCLKIFKLFTNTFVMTVLAEWGDRSQLATIVMAGKCLSMAHSIFFFLLLTCLGINDVSGVCVGGVLGHFICTGLAVICGALIAKKVSVRVVTFVGALVFIGFAVASLFIDPYEENHLVPDVDVSYTF